VIVRCFTTGRPATAARGKVVASIFARGIAKADRATLGKFGDTIFHLEPNVKEAPGGLRDFHASAWLRYLSSDGSELLGAEAAEHRTALVAAEFVSEVRCFLHYANGRNDNILTYELQEAAAERSLGLVDGQTVTAADWMRLYYRNARTLQRQLQRCLSLKPSAVQNLWQKLRTSVRPEKITIDFGQTVCNSERTAGNSGLHGVVGSRGHYVDTHRSGARPECCLAARPSGNWPISFRTRNYDRMRANLAGASCRRFLLGNYPGAALRPMHKMGLLTELLPEFGTIDALVIRDFYHRYTVDEHSLRAIEYLQTLANPGDARDLPFALLWKTVEGRDLLVLAILLHDVGKGMEVDHHVTGSLAALETVPIDSGFPRKNAPKFTS